MSDPPYYLDDEADGQYLEKRHGKWRQTGKRALSDIVKPSYHPEQLEARLRRMGYRELEAKAIVAQVCDGLRIRQAAKKIGKSNGFVSTRKIQRKVRELRAGKGLPAESQVLPSLVKDKPDAVSISFPDWNSLSRLRVWTHGWPVILNAKGGKAIPLCHVRRCASELFKMVGGMGKTGPSDFWPTSSIVPTPTPEFAKQIVQHIRTSPGALLSSDGRFFLETLVGLLEAASWGVDRVGWCRVADKKTRKTIAEDELPYMPYAASGWDRKHVAKEARKILEGLLKRDGGDSLVFPAEIMTALLDGILERVAELQKEWKAFSEGRKESGLAPFQEAHTPELGDFTDPELRRILDGDLLQVACRLAEREVGISAETFMRYHRRGRLRLREHPYAEGRLAFELLLEHHRDRKA